MNEFKLKLILTILGGVVFSFIFILLAFILPTTTEHAKVERNPSNKLEHVAKSFREK